MKTFVLIILLTVPYIKSVFAQDVSGPEKYGKTLNLGVGIGYYGYIGTPVPVGTINFEFDVARNFTLAPFIGLYSHKTYYYWGDPDKSYSDPSYRRYYYRSISIPAGLKGTYYFDQLFKANSKWDFYERPPQALSLEVLSGKVITMAAEMFTKVPVLYTLTAI